MAARELPGPGQAAAAQIPSPPRANDRLAPEDNGAAADSRANILLRTAPGLVQVSAGGTTLTSVGANTGTASFVLDAGALATRDAAAAAGGRPGCSPYRFGVVPLGAGRRPLVTLSGRAAAVDLARTGAGAGRWDDVLPIDGALAIARRIRASGGAQ